MNYITVIKYATIFFPAVAFLFAIPFILRQYHKYGSISFLKSIITYLFIYYLLCAYFLVILPLPKMSEVAKMTSPRMQLVPFDFVFDFLKHSSLDLANIETYQKAFTSSYFYVPAFNLLLTLPFGMFLRYYFKRSKKEVLLYSFLLSLFFELTQLSGLYFIYPRGYRLFDVDDLLLNTLGGLLGYFLSKPLAHFAPKIDEMNQKAKERGKVVSGARRTVAFFLDAFILLTVELLTIEFSKNNVFLQGFILLFYYMILPLFLNDATPAQRFLNIKVTGEHNESNKGKLFLRKILALAIYIIIPITCCNLIFYIPDNLIRELIGVWMIGILFIFYLLSTIKYIFTKKEMLYERISKTKLVSTIT